ncbi:MAG: stage III sporulation protein AD [Ruminococcaceae bacterium]|nr:stage III sporulation protein AD [Oscillospiraceae bacterium]
MDVVTVIAIALIAAFLSSVLKQYKPEYALLVSVVAAAVVLISLVSTLIPIISEIKDMMSDAAIPYKYITVLIKSVGICYITQFACDTCKDAGQTSLSSKVELAGRIAICLSALPLYKDLLLLTQTIIGKVS